MYGIPLVATVEEGVRFVLGRLEKTADG